MKRSQMLSKITAAIINHNDENSYIKREKALEIAKVILMVQEESMPEHKCCFYDESSRAFDHVWDKE